MPMNINAADPSDVISLAIGIAALSIAHGAVRI
jgi:hypothetical protein